MWRGCEQNFIIDSQLRHDVMTAAPDVRPLLERERDNGSVPHNPLRQFVIGLSSSLRIGSLPLKFRASGEGARSVLPAKKTAITSPVVCPRPLHALNAKPRLFSFTEVRSTHYFVLRLRILNEKNSPGSQ